MSSTSFLDAFTPTREPLSLQVARVLREAILSGSLADGEPIPPEKDLATSLGVGRSTVREALRILQAQGLLSGGDTVTTRRPEVDASGALPSAATALEAAVALGQLPLKDLVGLRLTIEQAALREIVTQRADLSDAVRLLDLMRATAEDPTAFHTADVGFHSALVQASGNRAFTLVMSVVRDAQAAHLLQALALHPDGQVRDQLVDEHQAIVSALQAGDAEGACALLRGHIQGFYGGSPT